MSENRADGQASGAGLVITTWNINSLRAHAAHFSGFLKEKAPDVICLQETKAQDHEFPVALFADAGYNVVFHGQKTYNGVAIASRLPIEEVERGLPLTDDPEARGIAAKIAGIRVVNLYVVNGKEVGDPKYVYKLRWLDALCGWVEGKLRPDQDVVVCGDFNLCPSDADTWDAAGWKDQVFCSVPERERFERLLAWGLKDAFREKYPGEFGRYAHTWWDYRGGAFQRGHGLRIDHHLVSASVWQRTLEVRIEREERKKEKPSDHAPVSLVLGPRG
jgi:exodeoxyribonuclease-3